MKRSEKNRKSRAHGEDADVVPDEFESGAEAADTSPEAMVDRLGSADQADGADSEQPAATAAQPEAERRLAEQQDRYLRLAAEYDNYRKRMVRERQEAAVRGQSDILRGLIDALDDLTRFAHVDPDATETRTVVEGVAMVERKMLKALTSSGLEVLNPLDQTFDPATMEAVATEPALSPEDDHVVAKVYQQGYRFNGQLLRPARVVVKQWNG